MTAEHDRPVSETGPTVPPSSATDETLAAPISGGAPASRDTVNDETIVPIPELVRLARVRDLAWSPDNRVVWSASHDGTARGFEFATGKATVLGVPSGFSEPAITALPAAGTLASPINPHGLRSLRMSPDGTHLAVAGGSGTVWIWNLTPADPASLSAYIKCASPWQLADTAIVTAPFDPASCSVLAH